jgi:hypothetical protein
MPEERAFVPVGFDPPTGLAVGELRLEPLGPEHNERDYAAWTSSIDHIRRTPGFDEAARWPREMSLAENRADLERHAADFLARAGFTFTVLDGVHDAQVLSWVRESAAEQDAPLRRAVAGWLTSDAWPFVRPLYVPLLS